MSPLVSLGLIRSIGRMVQIENLKNYYLNVFLKNFNMRELNFMWIQKIFYQGEAWKVGEHN
jgi:hypothetical protein